MRILFLCCFRYFFWASHKRIFHFAYESDSRSLQCIFLVHFVPCERARKDLIFSSEWNRVIIWYIIVIRGPSFGSVRFAYQLGNWSNVSRSWVKVSTFFIDRTFRCYVRRILGWFPCGVSLQNVCNSFRFIIETLLKNVTKLIKSFVAKFSEDSACFPHS